MSLTKKRAMRTVCFMLALFMVFTSFPAVAFAVDAPEIAYDYAGALESALDADVISEEASPAAIEAVAGVVPLNSGVVHNIHTTADLTAFLAGGPINGVPTSNNDEFIIHGSIAAPATAVQGRSYVDGQPFTGVVRGAGDGAAITGLRLAPRANAASPGAAYRNDHGFIRVLGHGARIENLTFVDPRHTDPGTNIADWNSGVVAGNIGLVAGRVMAGSAVTISNVTVRGTEVTNNAIITVDGPRGNTNSGRRVGGLIGATDVGSNVTITNTNVRVTVSHNTTGGTGSAVRNIASTGGLIGLAMGTVNVGQFGEVRVPGGQVHLTTAIGGTAGNRQFEHVGGAIGQLAGSGRAEIYRLASLNTGGATPSAAQLGAGSSAANRSVGGFIGSMNGSITFRHATNHANIDVTQGRIGGFIGRTQGPGATRIYDSTNLGRIYNSSTVADSFTRISSSGGFVGQADATLHVERSVNGNPDQQSHASIGRVQVHGRQGAGGIVGITASRGGSNTTLIDVENHGHIGGRSLRRYVGGLIGHARNPVVIEDSTNYGRITINNTSGAVGNRGIPNNIGGFIGQATNTVRIDNGVNRGAIVALGTVAVGNGGRLRMGGFIGLSTNRVTINGATNYANVWSGEQATANNDRRQHTGSEFGGIIARTEFRGARTSRRVDLNDVTNHGNIGYHSNNTTVGAQGRAGGIVGFSAHRAAAQGLNITGALNTGNIRTNVGTGASNTNRNNLMAAGGIVGHLDTLNSTISGAVNTGMIRSGPANADASNRGTLGGIVGRASRNNLAIIESGNEGVVASSGTGTVAHPLNHGVGGVVGNISRGNNTRILRTFNSGSIEGASQSTGGIVGSVRRRGTLLIEDVYNVGSVRARNGTNLGNGILGFRRNTASPYTLRRVFNSGNVNGAPIYSHLGTDTNAAATRAFNRFVFQGVYWDSSVHTGRAQNMRINTGRQRDLTGLQGMTTAHLTSGGLFEFQHPNWLTRGWIDNWIRHDYETWETYPWLAWQTPNTVRGYQHPEFFDEVEPGPCSPTAAASRTAYFRGIAAGSDPNAIPPGTITGGRVSNATRNVRTFIPYGARANGEAAGTATRLHREHMPRAAGNFSHTVTGITTPYMSVGLIDPQSVVGFNYNERFNNVVIMGVDAEHYRQIPTRTTLITWSRIYLDGVHQSQALSGILGLDDIQVGQRIDITARPGYAPAYHVISLEDLNHFDEHGRLLIRVPMERVPIEHLRIHLLNASAAADDPPQIIGPNAVNPNPPATGANRNRNPVSRRGPEGTTPGDMLALTPLTLDPVGNAAQHVGPMPPTSVFIGDGALWFDAINGLADQFIGEQISLWMTDIRNPNAAGTAADPFYVVLLLEDDSLEGDLFLTRAYEDEEGAQYDYPLPHGGRAGGVRGNPTTSQFFELEFYNPPLVGGTPTAWAGTGTGTGTSGTMGAWNSDDELTGHGLGTRRPDFVWEVQGATRQTLVRAVQRPNADGSARTIPGNGLNRTYRASPWVPLGELTEYHATTEALVYMLLNLDYEHHVEVRVYERTEILPGHPVDTPLPTANLYHDKDVGYDTGSLYNWNHVRLAAPNQHRFHPVRVFEGETLIARAEGFVNFGGYPAYASEYATILGEDETPPHIIRMFMERSPSGRLTGFVLPEFLMHFPDALGSTTGRQHNPIAGATVVLMAADGTIHSTTSADEPRGFFSFEGVAPGTYTLFATHPEWGSHTTVPTPVVMPAGGANQSSTIFLNEDLDSGFLLFVDVRENTATGPRMNDIASAALTVGAGSPQASTYYAPYRRLNLDARPSANNENWLGGSLLVSANRFQSETIVPIGDEVVRPVPGAQFGIVTVPLLRIVDLEVRNFPATPFPAPRLGPAGQSAEATREGNTIALPVTGGVFGNPSAWEVVTSSNVTLTAGTAYGWSFLGWYQRSVIDAHMANTPDEPIDAPAHGRGAVHTLTGLNADAEWVAVWGNQRNVPGVPNDYMLTINNVPPNPVTGSPVRPTDQVQSGYRHARDPVTLNPGVRTDDDLEFLGWYVGTANIPTPGTDIGTIPAANFIAPNVPHPTFTMPARDETLTALWGRDGLVGYSFDLTIDNLPIYPVEGPAVSPTGQVASGSRSAGQTVELISGSRTADDLEFLGWFVGTANVPALGTNISTILPANFIAPATPNPSFTMPARDETLTALWGCDAGYIGGRFNLLVVNVPAHPVTGGAATPAGQSPSGTSTRSAGQEIELIPGTRTADTLIFLGWYVGTANVPTPGTNISVILPERFIAPATPNPTFIMPASNERLTALWGCNNGYVGGRFNLTVNNMTEYEEDVNGRPTGQAPVTALRSAGEIIALVPGTRTDGLEFLGWFIGTENIPAIGDSISDIPAANLWVPSTANFTMPAENKTLTALWGLYDIVGGRRAIFHFYGFDEDSVTVPIIIGEPLDMAAVTAAMGELEEDLAGFAFWGWFEDETLSASGRTRPATSTNMSAGLRRPTVGTNGFNTGGIITQEIFDELEQSAAIHFYAIWALWGDVNDDDAVNGADVNLLSRYVLEFPDIAIVRPAAYVTRGANVTGADVNLLSRYVLEFPNIVLGRLPQ